MNAVDTNILVYSLDHHEPVKQVKAQQLLRQLKSSSVPTFLPWQVLCEFIQQLKRGRDKGQLTATEYFQRVQIYRNLLPLVLPTSSIIDRALDLAERFSLAHWDSVILDACLDKGITILYTEDMGAPRSIDGIQLINPFL